ncbi:MAG: thiamine pyrophosphate-binding protein [bacterium]
MASITGAKQLVESMKAAGVNRIYGIIGTSNVAFVDALYDETEAIRYISCRHEQVAATMADAEGRLTGKPGVVLLHSGPGALNSLISLTNAAKDCSPAIAITGAVKRKLRGGDGMLEVDHLRIFENICRGVFRVNSAAEIGEVFCRAWEAAVGYPHGPTLIEVPEDVWLEPISSPPEVRIPKTPLPLKPSETDVESALENLQRAERPLLLYGGGIAYAGAAELALHFAERWNLPVATTGNGRGTMPETHALCLGRTGFGGGNIVADFAVQNADFILAVGCTLSDMTTYEYTRPIAADVITVNLDEGHDLPGIVLRSAVRADAKLFLEGILKLSGEGEAPERGEWFASFESSRKGWQQIVEAGAVAGRVPLAPGYVCREIAKYMGDSNIVTVGAGMHLLYPMAYIPSLKPLTFLSAVNFGAMGFGMAAGIAAKLISPDRTVVSILGDGDALMAFQDIETAVREKIPVKIFILNDSAYRVLLFRQRLQLGGRIIGTRHGNPDFARLAESFGAKGIRIEKPDEVSAKVKETMDADVPVVVDVIIDPDDMAPTNLQAVLVMGQG